MAIIICNLQEQLFSAHSPADGYCEFVILSISLPLASVLSFSIGVASEGFTGQFSAQ